jgi:hypothetical protein
LFVLRYLDEIIHKKSVPRLIRQKTFNHQTVQDLKESVQECTTELAFNLDEVGISDWEGGKMKEVPVLATMRCQTRHHGRSRNVKHISAIVSVSTTEKSLIPYTITL